jgi:ubiquinone/menaquinone biosynthesis C-methylase UbiE
MSNVHLEMIPKERNIYEAAELYNQNRLSVEEMSHDLGSPVNSGGVLVADGKSLRCAQSGEIFPVKNNVIDFRNVDVPGSTKEWQDANKEFLNYHKSLTVYTMLNSLPLINYLRGRTGIGDIKNATVIDVGGGTGHTLCSFFRHPETLRYYNLDPNLRLLHDQFIRVYPEILHLKMGHLLCFGERLPFKSEVADLVMSLSSIDHFKDYKEFISEAFRVLKPRGRIFISSHLDLPSEQRVQSVQFWQKLFSMQFFERVARYLYFRKYRVGDDDHTYHFESVDPIETALTAKGFKIIEKEELLGNFWITAIKD